MKVKSLGFSKVLLEVALIVFIIIVSLIVLGNFANEGNLSDEKLAHVNKSSAASKMPIAANTMKPSKQKTDPATRPTGAAQHTHNNTKHHRFTYSIVDRNTINTPIKSEVELHAIVSGNITATNLKKLLKNIYKKINTTSSFENYEHKPTHIAIYLYTSLSRFKSHNGQWIAMLLKLGKSSSKKIQVKKRLITQLNNKPTNRYGISEAKRKKIFQEIIMAEDRAFADARRMYPLDSNNLRANSMRQLKKQAAETDSLMNRYKKKIAKQYGLTMKQLESIGLEGVTKNWPMPSLH